MPITAAPDRPAAPVSGDETVLLAEHVALVGQHLNDGVLLADQSGAVRYLNPPLERLFRVAAAATTARHISYLLSDLDLLNRAFNALATQRGEQLEVTLGDDAREYSVTFAPFFQGEQACLLMLFHDVSEVRRTERLQKNFIENVSHELRTPLTSIHGFIETLLGGALAEPENAERFLRIVGEHTQRLIKLVNTQIDLLKLERGMVTFRFAPVLLAELAASVEHVFARALAEHQLAWRTEIPAGFTAVLDRDRIEQVLINLVDNAIKFTPAGGSITLQVERLGQQVLLTVADTGCGIADDERTLVFRKFYKARGKAPRPARGFGLGLSITSEIIKAHHGAILLDSAEGKGTRVKISLPLLAPGEAGTGQ
ncbi:MAG TPA: ATP-binding protein [bacterium]|nr:ATP-binding protein [bacterium]